MAGGVVVMVVMVIEKMVVKIGGSIRASERGKS